MENLEKETTIDEASLELVDTNEDGVISGVEIIEQIMSPETLEELDHRLEAEGYSINTIEDAFEFLDEEDRDELKQYLELYAAAANEEAIEHALDGIINIIK